MRPPSGAAIGSLALLGQPPHPIAFRALEPRQWRLQPTSLLADLTIQRAYWTTGEPSGNFGHTLCRDRDQSYFAWTVVYGMNRVIPRQIPFLAVHIQVTATTRSASQKEAIGPCLHLARTRSGFGNQPL